MALLLAKAGQDGTYLAKLEIRDDQGTCSLLSS